MTVQNTGSPIGYAGYSGITRSGAEKYPNPFFDIASEYVPSDINQIYELCEFLMPDRYNEIRSKMKASGFRTSFACLFHGAPGMGNDLAVKVRYRLGSRNC